MKIKNIDLPHGLMLCPMAGVTDRAFRIICAEHGAEYAVTEMVSAKALVYEQRGRAGTPIRTAPLCRVDAAGSADSVDHDAPDAPVYRGIPTAVQLFGAEPEFIAAAAKLLCTGNYRGFAGSLPAAIDINMGCPVRKVTSNGEGSALMRDPGLAAAVAAAAVDGAGGSIPVTVKLRAGWDSAHINAVEVARAVEREGVSAVCVHARTREQMYAPGIDLSVITRVREAIGVPVFGNGDISSATDALDMLRMTGCSGVGIARGAIGNPWLFAEIAAALEGVEFIPPTSEELVATAVRHARLTVEFKGEARGIAEAKPQIARYIRGIPGAVKLRDGIIRATTLSEVEEKLGALLD